MACVRRVWRLPGPYVVALRRTWADSKRSGDKLGMSASATLIGCFLVHEAEPSCKMAATRSSAAAQRVSLRLSPLNPAHPGLGSDPPRDGHHRDTVSGVAQCTGLHLVVIDDEVEA